MSSAIFGTALLYSKGDAGMKAKISGLGAMGRLVWPKKRLLTNLERSKSTWRMVGLLLLALSSTPAVSGIVFTTDTSSTLIGNFSATTFPDHIEVTPGTFNLAVGGDAGCNV